MLMVVVLLIMVVGSVVFGFTHPWDFPDIASNWGGIDITLYITFIACGIVFTLVGIFIVYCVWKYRYREDARADYEPENERLEFWLTVPTAIGVVILLAPGLFVWDEFVRVPANAMEVEVMAKQWSWAYRFPGEDGKLGTVDVKNTSFANPFGMNEDPNGEDDVLITRPQLHVPLGQPIKILLRSNDVLHNFMVHDIRSKMDAVPGMVTYFWFEPRAIGEYEVVCAELCGRGHYNMRGTMVVESQEDFDRWLDAQPTWNEMRSGVSPSASNPLATRGRQVAEDNGCFACHTMDGSPAVGPTWQGLWGSVKKMTDGSEVTVDAAYIDESVRVPAAKLVEGFPGVMIPYSFSEEDMEALVEFLRVETGPREEAAVDPATLGEQIVQQQACIACHSLDGTKGIGPTWQGMFGRTVELTDGTMQLVDEAYLRESITDPNAKMVAGFAPTMIAYPMPDDQLDAVVAYIKDRFPAE